MFLAHYGPAAGGRSPENQPAPVIPATRRPKALARRAKAGIHLFLD